MDLDPESEQIREVYAYFGLALYMSQCLEHQIANSLLVLDLIPSNVGKIKSAKQWEESIDSFLEGQFQKTLGKMIRNLQAVTSVPANLEVLLTQALEKRNFLAHHYFRERAMEFTTTEGRDLMMAELNEAKNLFKAADDALVKITEPMYAKYGITKALIEKCFQEMVDESRGAS